MKKAATMVILWLMALAPLAFCSCGGEECQPTVEMCNGKDDDCDNQIDEDWPQSCSNPCGAGTIRCVGGALTACDAPTPQAETCDGKDNDCDGAIDEDVKNRYYADSDHDTYGDPSNFVEACTAPSGYVDNDDDCKDSDAAIHPGATEECDGHDNNCDGTPDEGCTCTAGQTQACGDWGDQGECELGSQTCSTGGTWGDCTGGVKPATESCNRKDDDCDGQVDDSLPADSYESNDSCEAAAVLETVPESGPDDPLLELADASVYLTDGSDDADWFKIPTDEGTSICVPFTSECCYYFVAEFYPPEGSEAGDMTVCVHTDGECGAFESNYCSTSGDWDPAKGAYVMSFCWTGTCGFEDGKTFYLELKGASSGISNCGPYNLKYLFYRSDEACSG